MNLRTISGTAGMARAWPCDSCVLLLLCCSMTAFCDSAVSAIERNPPTPPVRVAKNRAPCQLGVIITPTLAIDAVALQSTEWGND